MKRLALLSWALAISSPALASNQDAIGFLVALGGFAGVVLFVTGPAFVFALMSIVYNLFGRGLGLVGRLFQGMLVVVNGGAALLWTGMGLYAWDIPDLLLTGLASGLVAGLGTEGLVASALWSIVRAR